MAENKSPNSDESPLFAEVDEELERLLAEEEAIIARSRANNEQDGMSDAEARAARVGQRLLGLDGRPTNQDEVTPKERRIDLNDSIRLRPALDAFFKWYGTDKSHRTGRVPYARRRRSFELRRSRTPKSIQQGDRAMSHYFSAISHDPAARELYNLSLDEAIEQDRSRILTEIENGKANYAPVVIVGAGYHAAVLAAEIFQKTGVRPVIIDDGERIGGHFRQSHMPGHVMNNRNRALGDYQIQRAGDRGSIFPIGSAAVQVSDLSGAQYADNADTAMATASDMMLYGIPLHELHYEGSKPKRRSSQPGKTRLEVTDSRTGKKYTIFTDLVLNTRGLGENTYGLSEPDEKDLRVLDEERENQRDPSYRPRILTADQFIARTSDPRIPFPLEGYSKVIVIGGGDSANMVIKRIIGAGPQQLHDVAELDTITDIVQICSEPSFRENALQNSRAVYHVDTNELPRKNANRYSYRTTRINRRVEHLDPDGGYIYLQDSLRNDITNAGPNTLIVFATGNKPDALPDNLESVTASPFKPPVALKRRGIPEYFVGPQTRLPIDPTLTERIDYLGISENAVAAFGWEPKDRQLVEELLKRSEIPIRGQHSTENVITLGTRPRRPGRKLLNKAVRVDLDKHEDLPLSHRVPIDDMLRLSVAMAYEGFENEKDGGNEVSEFITIKVKNGIVSLDAEGGFNNGYIDLLARNPLFQEAIKRMNLVDGELQLGLPVASNGRVKISDVIAISAQTLASGQPRTRAQRIPSRRKLEL